MSKDAGKFKAYLKVSEWYMAEVTKINDRLAAAALKFRRDVEKLNKELVRRIKVEG